MEPKTPDKPKPTPHEELPFHFTSADALMPDQHGEDNPHAKATTQVKDVVDALSARFPDAVLSVHRYAGEHTVLIRKDQIVAVCTYLKEEKGFKYLVALGGVDRFTDDERFEVFYNLVNMKDKKRIRLKIRIEEDEPEVETVTGVYRAAGWHERETWT